MKKSFALILAVVMLLAVTLSSCKIETETTTATPTEATSVKIVDEFDFIRNFTKAYLLSEDDINYDITKLLTGKLADFEIETVQEP